MKTLQGPRDARVFQFTCTNARCAARLEATEHEGAVHSSYQGTSISFRCPHCERETYVDWKEGR